VSVIEGVLAAMQSSPPDTKTAGTMSLAIIPVHDNPVEAVI